MDFTLSAQHRELRRTLREFFTREAPLEEVNRHDRDEEFNAELYRKAAGIGLCGMAFGEEYGGSDADQISLCIAVEEVARASSALAYAWLPTATFCAKGIARFGTDEQKKEILPKVAAGTVRMAMGLTEPDAGSDLAHLSTRAVRDGDDFVINGQKVFTTGADTADHIFAFVRTDPDASPSRGLSVLLVPRQTEGVTIRPLRKLAGQATHTCEVFLNDVRVPKENLVGELGRGTAIIFDLLDAERIYVGAEGTGLGQGALDLALKYAQERVQFGKPIIEHQAVGHMLADMAMDVQTARLITWQAAWRLDQGLDCTLEASMAKVHGSEAGTRCAARGMQILGGYSYMVEYGMERYWRETKLYEIAGGTNQIMRNMIAGQLGRRELW
ncbi:acyl-CoA dehydrogenase family protein [Thermobifida halotolerans]|uniref:Acyl-CoA dehydrogenase family protein n=1 Tax=Thermobifida halotolerans TaxID=483545 RepID=A0A399G407_9ACTN|nr:acyl-CoA dehydrogenase family protein [Thermobifida halotolerans]UOE21222.1 acyl-CoA dehydrogenase family protein [Thermobifida halotolerans]